MVPETPTRVSAKKRESGKRKTGLTSEANISPSGARLDELGYIKERPTKTDLYPDMAGYHPGYDEHAVFFHMDRRCLFSY